jgi:hypothetical protein
MTRFAGQACSANLLKKTRGAWAFIKKLGALIFVFFFFFKESE